MDNSVLIQRLSDSYPVIVFFSNWATLATLGRREIHTPVLKDTDLV